MTPEDRQAVLERIDAVIGTHVAGRDDLYTMQDFPADVWQALATSGLLGLSLPKAHGGLGGDYAMLAAGAHRMNELGGVMGVTTTWVGHNLNTRLHLYGKGTEEQQAAWLPRLASGEGSVTMAISEPGVGAHPKHLSTRARREGADYVIDGEKAYLTNGPLAAVFIVLAVTGETDGRKSFSALLVPRDTPGLSLTPGVKIDFLHPAPHCGIALSGCRVPAENVLGQADGGLAETSLPMRAIEDVLAASSKAGALHAELRFLAQAVRGKADKDALAELGQLLAKADALSALAARLAADLDEDDTTPERLNSASAGFRGFAKALQDDIDAFIAARGLALSSRAAYLRHDLVKSFGIARSAHAIQAAKRAKAYMDNEEQT